MLRYRLDELGWYQFEQLCQSLLQKDYGVAVEAWGGSKDLGRDAYCESSLPFPAKHELTDGPFVFQAKFVENANAPGAKPSGRIKYAVEAELQKIQDRVESGEWPRTPNVYCILTNVTPNATLREEMQELVGEVLPNAEFCFLGGKDISAMLDNAANVRCAYPQILSVADLETLISDVYNKAIIEKSSLAIQEAQDLAPNFVQTEPFNESLIRLERYHFLMLAGPPEMGKTAIARIIGLNKVGQGWQCFECASPDEFFNVYNAEVPQLYIADDAFGSTEYSPDKAEKWAESLSKVLRAVNKDHWMIFTSRTAPLHEALRKLHLQGHAERFPNPSKIEVDAARLNPYEKARILYWHAKTAHLDEIYRQLLVHHYDDIIYNNHFTPFRIYQLVKFRLRNIVQDCGYDGRAPEYKPGNFISRLLVPRQSRDHAIHEAIRRELEEPTRPMKLSFDNLSVQHKSFLIGLLDVKQMPTPEDTYESYRRHNTGDKSISAESVSKDLLGHFLRESDRSSTKKSIQWVHPTWRDLVIQTLHDNEYYRQPFLRSATLDGVLLALSTAGGKDGERIVPLLVDPADWASLEGAATSLIKSGQLDAIQALLTSLDTLARSLRIDGPAGQVHKESFQAVLTSILLECTKRWNAGSDPIPILSLQTYAKLSVLIDPIPPVPSLKLSWIHYWDSAKMALTNRVTTENGLGAVMSWFEYVQLVESTEPRFLTQSKFPEEYVAIVGHFLEIELDLDFERTSLIYESQYTKEIDRCNQLSDVFWKISNRFPALSEQALTLAKAAEDQSSTLESVKELKFFEREYDDDEILSRSRDEAFDIGEMFEQLLYTD